MDTKKFITGTVVGGIVYFILGFLFYAILFEGFFQANAGSATGVMKTDMAWWPMILGNLAFAALFSYIFLNWAQISTFATGFKAGAIIGLFIGIAFDMIMLDTTNIMTMQGVLVDIVIGTVMAALTGGVIGMVIGMGGDTKAAAA